MGHQEVQGQVVYFSTDRILAVELFERIMKAVTSPMCVFRFDRPAVDPPKGLTSLQWELRNVLAGMQ